MKTEPESFILEQLQQQNRHLEQQVTELSAKLTESEQICTCCGGSLHEMSTETRSEIAIVPPQVKVVRHVRQVYACRHCERNELQTPIVTTPMPKPVYPGSLASPSILAHVCARNMWTACPSIGRSSSLPVWVIRCRGKRWRAG